MRNKLIINGIIILLIVFAGRAQNRQSETTTTYRSLIPTSKQSLLKNVDMIANTQIAFRSDFYEGEHVESKFRVEHDSNTSEPV